MSFKQKILFLFIVTLLTRFIAFNWGNGYFFHPDENNMATAIAQFSSQNLNPNFFAYGQFTLYLGYFTLKILGLTNTFINSVLVLRLYSAIFSVLSVGLIYLISKKLFSQKNSLLLVLLTIFNPGLIQLAHFGTTESFLILIFLIEIYLSQKIYEKPKNYLLYIFAGIIVGIAISTKISSLIFLGPILLVSLMNFIKLKNKLIFIPKLFLLLIFTVVFYLLSSPYNLLKSQDFFSTMNYETNVATGQTKVFYTTQFSKSIPYLFQFIHIFPYVSGIFQFIFAIIALILLIKNYRVDQKKYLYWFLILVPCFVYFLYFGQLYVKWTRFMSPIFFFFPLLSVYFISTLKSRLYRLISIFLACLPGIFFLRIYFYSDIRFSASKYLINTVPQNSSLLSESGNVVNIPILPNNFNITNYDFYNNYPNYLSTYLLTADYIIVPSRRVFKNYNLKYHQSLFNGSLSFQKIKTFSPSYDFLLNSENAEETWSVFDHPTIRIYKKNNSLTLQQYSELL